MFGSIKGDLKKYGTPPPAHVELPAGTSSLGAIKDATSRKLFEQTLPRGVRAARWRVNREESAAWSNPKEIADMTYEPWRIPLGKFDGRALGYLDDKPMVTIASARSGKSSTVLLPTLLSYHGSMVVLDPKGELAAATAVHRKKHLGQKVYVLDPFGVSGEATKPLRARYNPLAELDPESLRVNDDVGSIAEAMILYDGGRDSSHWTDSARAVVKGLILHALRAKPDDRTLVHVRDLLMLTAPELAALKDHPAIARSADPEATIQNMLFRAMASDTAIFGGALAAAGNGLLRKDGRERASILSTAETQTQFLDSRPMRDVLSASDFKLADLRGEHPMTIYLCLPASEMEKHARWLRVFVQTALSTLERCGPADPKAQPILFMMEEFPVLGHMPIMEKAAAYFPGYGVKLWAVIQDLTQLQRHYKATWETFLGNAGLVQAFANSDQMTLNYLSQRLGSLNFVRGSSGVSEEGRDHRGKERLAYAHELQAIFSRESGYQILLRHDHPPIAAQRLSHDDVANLRAAAEHCCREARKVTTADLARIDAGDPKPFHGPLYAADIVCAWYDHIHVWPLYQGQGRPRPEPSSPAAATPNRRAAAPSADDTWIVDWDAARALLMRGVKLAREWIAARWRMP